MRYVKTWILKFCMRRENIHNVASVNKDVRMQMMFRCLRGYWTINRVSVLNLAGLYKKPKLKLILNGIVILLTTLGKLDAKLNETSMRHDNFVQLFKPKLPPFLTDSDFYNAKFVDMSKPLGPIINDQRFPASPKRYRRGSVVVVDSDKWPNGRIPYVLSAAYTINQRAVLARAIASYNSKTCIRFVPKTSTDPDYVVISKLDGCYADFARVGGRQQVSLADECIDYATIIHEFMHVIGFIHEHQREDREAYVKIVWENIIDGANNDFDKLSAVGLSNYGETYDYFSIMHYESTEGSRNGKNTIEAKHGEYTPLMGKSADFTTGDLNRVNRAYNCSSHVKYWRQRN